MGKDNLGLREMLRGVRISESLGARGRKCR
jgi:hypothetical protein